MGSSLEALENLAARRRFGIKPGLDTITRLCAALGEPQKKLRGVIHIAGTNGKGAVAAILDACLRQSALDDGVCPRVGRYTSPHLVKLNERFFLNGAPIDDATLEAVADKVSAAIDHSDLLAQDSNAPTFFEALTAVAFSLYAELDVDYVILETGLGGRLDATNICEPKMTIITRIGLDHCAWLGDSVEKIAAEKAGIIKPGVPVVLGCNEEAVQAVIKARAKEVGAPYYYAPDLASASEIPADFPLRGTFNRENALTALAALKVLSRNSGFPILDSSFFILHFSSGPDASRRCATFLLTARIIRRERGRSLRPSRKNTEKGRGWISSSVRVRTKKSEKCCKSCVPSSVRHTRSGRTIRVRLPPGILPRSWAQMR